jgi:hypothetical protein
MQWPWSSTICTSAICFQEKWHKCGRGMEDRLITSDGCVRGCWPLSEAEEQQPKYVYVCQCVCLSM